MLSFAQVNLHKASQATMLAGGGLEGRNRTILLMTEPYTYANHVVGLPNKTKLVFARSKGIPRACIAATPDVVLTTMENWCNEDCAVALTRVGGTQTVIVSLYLDITSGVQPRWLDKLMEMIDQKGYPIIMGIDTNAHSSLWGPDTNKRGEAFEDFIFQYGLNVENMGTAPTYETRRGNRMIGTHIDVTLTRGLHSGVKSWRVCRDYNASDHNTIKFEIESHKSDPELVRPWDKADWKKFSEILAGADYGIPEAMSMKKLDRLVERLYRTCLLYTSPSPRDRQKSRMPSSA